MISAVQLFSGMALTFVGSVSETTGTPAASGSRVMSSIPLPVDTESSKDKERNVAAAEKKMDWGNLLADIYPLIKIMEVQVCDTFLLQVRRLQL